ncbi:hypothetical protein K0M31_011000 [Melipona bicolor]|uniref:Uncharacterized protein n=1 Tax=Melipona bicolor TaxID=60889 RepID=A0AA40FKH6_9HYME|nr:hypothetical protein K0M31_011000 [Melipona bicolor]
MKKKFPLGEISIQLNADPHRSVDPFLSCKRGVCARGVAFSLDGRVLFDGRVETRYGDLARGWWEGWSTGVIMQRRWSVSVIRGIPMAKRSSHSRHLTKLFLRDCPRAYRRNRLRPKSDGCFAILKEISHVNCPSVMDYSASGRHPWFFLVPVFLLDGFGEIDTFSEDNVA